MKVADYDLQQILYTVSVCETNG